MATYAVRKSPGGAWMMAKMTNGVDHHQQRQQSQPLEDVTGHTLRDSVVLAEARYLEK